MNSETTIAPMIAVVDDDESLGRSLARFLSASGFRPVIYQSAETFLADTPRPEFDCLIVDLQLDGISGTDLRKRLISAGLNIPTILMTARYRTEIDETALQTVGAVFLHKSTPGKVLLATIQRLMHP